MIDPPRLASRGDLSADLLLAARAREETPSDASRRRAAAALGLSVAAGAVALTAATVTTTAAASATSKAGAIGGTALVLKWIGVTVVGTMLAAGAVHYVEPGKLFARRTEPAENAANGDTAAAAVAGRGKAKAASSASDLAAPPLAAEASAQVSDPEAPDTPIAAVTAAAPLAPSVVQNAPPSSASVFAQAPPAPTLADEVKLLDQARAQMAAGDRQGALSTLATYKKTIPNGMLAPEASVLRVEALHQIGDDVSARAVGEAFLAAHPSGPQARRIHSIVDHLAPAANE